MVDIEIVREWLAKADEDFEFARINFEEGKPFLGQICFHFQQAAEKYLKSYIIAHELEFLKIHDLPLWGEGKSEGLSYRRYRPPLTSIVMERYPFAPHSFIKPQAKRSSCNFFFSSGVKGKRGVRGGPP